MAAPKKNQFWKQRTKHGRDKLFKDADILWKAASGYFDWCDNNPWYRIDFKGKDADRVEIPTARPYTITGLCLYLGTSEAYWRQFRSGKLTEDFSTVITRIEDVIRTQKFEGAAVGAFNPSIIARDLGLVDKKEHTGKDGTPLIPQLDKLTPDQLEQLRLLQNIVNNDRPDLGTTD